MLGLDDMTIAIAYVISVASTVGCVVYGVVNWNSER